MAATRSIRSAPVYHASEFDASRNACPVTSRMRSNGSLHEPPGRPTVQVFAQLPESVRFHRPLNHSRRHPHHSPPILDLVQWRPPIRR